MVKAIIPSEAILKKMAISLGLGTIFYVTILLVNAVAILHEERFLARSKNSH